MLSPCCPAVLWGLDWVEDKVVTVKEEGVMPSSVKIANLGVR
jgi:hypothetical protein